ncbi:MAG: 50S ribosomal protein L6 [Candidatus Omnitrophica bacterium]|nr:50S ribosomal protein L6 [Candidatus Omnitrophota bacterium]
MSRIGKQPIVIPDKVKVTPQGRSVTVEGPKGTLALTLPELVNVAVANGQAAVTVTGDTKQSRSLHGTFRSLVANMVHGVTQGFTRELEIVGVGFRAQVAGSTLQLFLGFSHPVDVTVPAGITVKAPKPTQLVIEGADKQIVGQLAADIRAIFPPEPYKGKGIRYTTEVVRRKAGKAAAGAKGTA